MDPSAVIVSPRCADFPHVAIGVGEGSRHAAPPGAGRRPHDLGAGPLGISKYDRDFFGARTLWPSSTSGAPWPPVRITDQ